MRQLVVGLGEVGEPLRQLLGARGYDVSQSGEYGDRVDVLHIAFPFTRYFVEWVQRYQTAWAPDLTIIHSTVPIGTTRQIPQAVHSPVNGRHGDMLNSLRWLPKWIGGNRAEEAAKVLESAGMFTRCTHKPETTEALKLLCLAKYGAANALARFGQELELKDEDIVAWDRMYNTEVPPDLRRPIILPDGYFIGGHCVVPGVRMLNETNPHPLLKGVLQYGA